jgi:hypothetical protein
MTRRKSFTSFNGLPNEDEVEIEVNGKIFKCRPMLPGPVILDFMAGIDENAPATMVKALRTLFNEAIVEDQLEDWEAFTRDPANKVDLDLLSEIGGYLAEVYTGRPTNQPG